MSGLSSSVPRRLEYLVYIVVALGAVLPALVDSRLVSGDGIDLYGTLWFYWWIQDSVRHLHSPGFTDLFFYPLGKDIFSHTGNNFVDAFVSVPFQWVFGFPTYQPVFVAFMMVVNALCFRPLARRVVDPGRDTLQPGVKGFFLEIFAGARLSWAAFLAVLLWSFCSYILFELTCGRLTQAFLWFMPLAFCAFLELEHPHARASAAVRAGLFTALQALTYWFMGYFMALVFGWLALCMLFEKRKQSSELLRLLKSWAIAAGVAALVVAPPVLLMYLRAQEGAVPGMAAHQTGLLELPRSLGNNVAATLHGYWLMERWGAPMLGFFTWGIAILLGLALGRGRLRWAGATVLVLLFGLGPSLPPIDDKPIRMFHYLLAYHLLPFFDRLWFPYRLVVMAFLCLSLLGATGFARVQGWLERFSAARWPRLPRGTLPALLVFALLALNLGEQHARFEYPFVTRNVDPPKIFTWIRDQAREDGRRSAIIHLPIGVTQPSIIFQTIHGLPMFGGMGENAPLLWPEGYDRRLKMEFIRYLYRVTRFPEETQPPPSDNGRQKIVAEGYRWLALHREVLDDSLKDNEGELEAQALPFRVTEHLRANIGEPIAVDGGIVLWDLESRSGPVPGLEPDQTSLTTRTWSPSDRPAYEVVMRARGRMPAGGTPRRRSHNPGQDPNQGALVAP